MTDAPPPIPTQAHTNSTLYSLWAPTYDSDGNILQAVDNLQLEQHLLPQLVSAIEQQQQHAEQPLPILDLGCGTGRTTLKLATLTWPANEKRNIDLQAWDSSAEMLSLARAKLHQQRKQQQSQPTTTNVNVKLAQIDLLSSPPSIPKEALGRFAGLTSTLVLEHLPLALFFGTVASLLAPGGVAVVTNMHPDMGAASVAGFKDESGVRLRGDSYLHGVGESARAAEEAGLRVLGDVGEVEVSGGMFDMLVGAGAVREPARKWVGRKIWFGMVLRKEA